MNGQTKEAARLAGVMLPLAALPSPHGAGDMGEAAYRFVELLAGAGASYWQVLPLNPAGYGNSPYQAYASCAGDPIYISLDALHSGGLLADAPPPFNPEADSVAFEDVRAYKEIRLREAFRAFRPGAEYESFAAQPWVFRYGVFMAFKKANDNRCWNTWPAAQREWPEHSALDLATYEKDIRFEMFQQYLFYTQWAALKAHANGLGVRIIGDIPIYVGLDSLDVWTGRQNFLLDDAGEPLFVAGVPPDYFSATGQRWGNPIYNWAHLQADGFRFWVERLRHARLLFDIVRIDHFRGFDTYWKIPATCPTAVEGEWAEAPGYALFDTVLAAAPDLTIIAEDLGMLRDEVYALRDHFGLRGMNILQFTLDPAKPIAPRQGPSHMVIYTGTHDNQTTKGWFEAKPFLRKLRLRRRLFQAGYRRGSVPERLVRLALDNPADIAVVPAQDLMGLGDGARMNTPGTVGSPNWEWKLTNLTKLAEALEKYERQIKESGRVRA